MNRKKWTTITLISLALIVIEVIALFVFIMPAVRINTVFKSLEQCTTASKNEDYNKTHTREAQDAINKLSSSKQKKVEKIMADFVKYECKQYEAGSIDYSKLKCLCNSVEELKGYDGFASEYLQDIYGKEIIRLYEDACEEYLANGWSDEFENIYDEVSDMYYDCDDTTSVNDACIASLKEKFEAFKAGTIDYDTMKAYAEVSENMFHGDAMDYAYNVYDTLYNYKSYSDAYETIQGYYDDKDYFEVIDTVDYYGISEDDETGFYEKFQELRTKAYDEGKTYYVQQVKDYIADGDTYYAEDLMEKLEEYYGSDLDLSELSSALKGPWVAAYVSFMSNWEETLKSDVASGSALTNYDDISLINIDEDKPSEIALYDFDGDETPELVLQGSSYIHIYKYDGTNVVYTGSFVPVGISNTPGLIVSPNALPDGYVGYTEIELSGTSWTLVEYYVAAEDGSVYIVNGSETSAEECESLHNDIASHEDSSAESAYTSTDISNYENYIDSYENN